MLHNFVKPQLKKILITFLLMVLEFSLNGFLTKFFSSFFTVFFVFGYLSYLVFKDPRHENYMINMSVAFVSGYLYTLFNGYGLLFFVSMMVGLVFSAYKVHLNNSKLNLYIYCYGVYIGVLLYTFIYNIYIYNLGSYISLNLIVVGILIIFINANLTYFMVNSALSKKEIYSRRRQVIL